MEGHQQYAILPEGHQQRENDETRGSSCFIMFIIYDPSTSTIDNKVIQMGIVSLYSFVHNYMVNKYKYKGGGLGKYEQGMPYFPDNTKAQMTKDGLGSDNSTTKGQVQ